MSVDEIELTEETVVVQVNDAGTAKVVDPIADDALKGAGDPTGEREICSVYVVVVKETIETRYIDAHGDTWAIAVGFGPEAGIPTDATLSVSELPFEDYVLDAAAVLSEGEYVAQARFFDIKIMAEGAEVQPLVPVQVRVSLQSRAVGMVSAVHITELGAERVEVWDDGKDVLFSAKSFSVYGVEFVVDFESGDETFSIAGLDSIWLSELLEALKMGFTVADVRDVVFSDPSLIRVDAIDGDWLLTSLEAFSTQEMLMLTLNDGSVIEIRVTDAQHVTNLAYLISEAVMLENGDEMPWPALVRENMLYDLRLTFSEEDHIQFMDDNTEMYYQIPEGIDAGDVDFEHEFTLDVGDGVRLNNNHVRYDAELNALFVRWNTEDNAAFNKLKASNSAKFRVDMQVKFTFSPDKLNFGNDVTGEVIRDTRADLDLQKTGVYDKDNDKVDYTVTIQAYGEPEDVHVRDVLFGTALHYLATGGENGITWSSSDPSRANLGVTPQVLYYTEEALEQEQELLGVGASESWHAVDANNPMPMGFELTIPKMSQDETLTLYYSAAVNYDYLTSGAGTRNETYNQVEATINGVPHVSEFDFEGEMRYVELDKTHTRPINWNDDRQAVVDFCITVNNKPKVSLAGRKVKDRIYAGDVESLKYTGDGLNVQVYDAGGVFLGEYDVDWGTNDPTTKGVLVKEQLYYVDWRMLLAELLERYIVENKSGWKSEVETLLGEAWRTRTRCKAGRTRFARSSPPYPTPLATRRSRWMKYWMCPAATAMTTPGITPTGPTPYRPAQRPPPKTARR